MSVSAVNPFNLPSYRQMFLSYDADSRALWYHLNPESRPNFNKALLAEIRDFQTRVARQVRARSDDVREKDASKIDYLVLASLAPAVFNFGGDLALFVQLIEAQDRDGLMSYGRACVDAVYHNATGLQTSSLTTVSLVQGTALGGGFEAALSSNVLIAERSAQLGFPEILFNLFPGMGAYNLLVRRVDPVNAQRLLSSGSQYSAEKLYEMGIVDVLAEDGEGVAAVRDFIRRRARARNGHLGIQRARERALPLDYEALIDIVAIWADTALKITARDLRTMKRIAAAQSRRPESTPVSIAEQRETCVPSFPAEPTRAVDVSRAAADEAAAMREGPVAAAV